MLQRRRFSCLNLIKGACQVVVETSLFWMVVAALTIVEPILCSYNIESLYQQMVLLISSVLYVIQLIGVATLEWDKILHYERLFKTKTSRFRSTKSVMTEQSMTVVNMYKFFTAEGEYMFEFCCLVGGWCTIFRNPGLAMLRCFRVFRLLWFYEVKVLKDGAEFVFVPIVGQNIVGMIFKVFKFAIKALSALGNELFNLSEKTRGSLLLILIFFYSAFVLGMTSFYETDLCPSIGSCTFILMRLTFMDGNGFDFAYSLSSNHRFLFSLVILYYCITTFGILNGLVGIFGTIFAVAANDTFAASDDDDSDVQQEEILFSKLEAENEESTLDEEAGKSNNNNNSSSNNDRNNSDDDAFMSPNHHNNNNYQGNNNNNNNNYQGNNNNNTTNNNKHEGEEESSQAQRRVHFINAMKSETGASKFALKELYKKELEREIERVKEIEMEAEAVAAAEKMAVSIDLELSNSNEEDEVHGAVARSISEDDNNSITRGTYSTTEQPHKHNSNNNQGSSNSSNYQGNTLRAFVGKHLLNGRHHRNAYIAPEANLNYSNTDQSHISPRESMNFESPSLPSFSPSSSPLPTHQRLSNTASFASMSSFSPSKPKRNIVGASSSSTTAAAVMMQRATSMRKIKSSIQMDGGGMFAAIALQAVESTRKKTQNKLKATAAAAGGGGGSYSVLDTRISGLEDKINDQSIMISSLLSQIELLNDGLRRYQPNLFRNSLSLPIRESDEDEEEEESVHSIGSVKLLDSAKVQDF